MIDELTMMADNAFADLGGIAVRANDLMGSAPFVKAQQLPLRPETVEEAVSVSDSYSFRPTINAAGTGITIEEGDVVLGPGTWIEWASITGKTTTPAVTSTNTHVWLEINVVTPSASMVVGTKAAMMAAMTSSVTTMAYPLIGTTWSGATITSAKRLLEAVIPRAAG